MSPAERGVGREARFTLLMVFLVGLRRRDPGAVVNAVVAAIGTYFISSSRVRMASNSDRGSEYM